MFFGIDVFVLSVVIVVKIYVIWGYFVYLICNFLMLRLVIYFKVIFKLIVVVLFVVGVIWVVL